MRNATPHPDREGAAVAVGAPAAIRGALLEALARRRRRRLRAVVVALSCVVVAAAALIGGGMFAPGPERVLAVDDSGGDWVRISILDGQAGAEEMTKELQDAGIDAQVQLVPSVPQFVGHWMGVGQVDMSADVPCDLSPVQETPRLVCTNPPLLADGDADFHGDVFQIRRDAIEKLKGTRTIFYVGREPEAGETPLEFPPSSDHPAVAPGGGM